MTISPPGSYVPYARRRNTPAQLDALNQLFKLTQHPTRTQRQALANDIGLELKSVTNWFQNRRQTSRRKSFSSNENSTRTQPPYSQTGTRPRNRRSKTPLDRSKVSLDRIATLSERPGLALQSNSPRLPFTPRKGNVRREKPSSPSKLWTHMLSSPVVPPSSPGPEEARLSALSIGTKVLFPLEWACHRARQRQWVDEGVDGLSARPVMRHYAGDDGTEPQAIHLESSAAMPVLGDASSLNCKDSSALRPQFEDVEAAITLLDFKTGSS